MQTKTALAVAGSVLAIPSTALAAAAQDSDTTDATRCAPPAASPSTRTTDDRLVREPTCASLAAPRASATTSCARATRRRSATTAVSVLRVRNATRCPRESPGSSAAPTRPPPPPAPRGHRGVRVGRRPAANTGNGDHGKYQFTRAPGRRRRLGQPRCRLRGRAGQSRGACSTRRRARAVARLRRGSSEPYPRRLSPAALRDQFPILERIAYLNAGHDGPVRPPLPRRSPASCDGARPRGARTRTSSAASQLQAELRDGYAAAARLRGRRRRADDLDERGARRCSPGWTSAWATRSCPPTTSTPA